MASGMSIKKQRPRTWIPLDTNFEKDDKIRACSPTAIVLYVFGLSRAGCENNNGYIRKKSIHTFGVRNYMKAVNELIEQALWVEEGDDYRIAAWHRWNPSTEEKAIISTKRSIAGSKGGRSSSASRYDSSVSNQDTTRTEGEPFGTEKKRKEERRRDETPGNANFRLPKGSVLQ